MNAADKKPVTKPRLPLQFKATLIRPSAEAGAITLGAKMVKAARQRIHTDVAAAEFLGVSLVGLADLTRLGQLPTRTLDGQVVYHLDDIEAYLKATGRKLPPAPWEA